MQVPQIKQYSAGDGSLEISDDAPIPPYRKKYATSAASINGSNRPVAESSLSSVAQKVEGNRTYLSHDSSIFFEYPAEWGNVVLSTKASPSEGYQEALLFENLQWKDGKAAGIGLRKFVESDAVMETCYEEICSRLDLLQERDDIAKNPHFVVNGISILRTERYDPSGGSVSRYYTFYTDEYRVQVFGAHSLFPVLDQEWQAAEKRGIKSYAQFITEYMTPEWGHNNETKIDVLMEKKPHDEFQKFFDAVEAMTRSIIVQ